MKKLFTENIGLKLLSFALACLLWFLVADIGDPKDTKYFNNIPVILRNDYLITNENKVYEVLDNSNTVRVAVYAPRSIIDNLSASDIVAEADCSKLTDINTIAITYRYMYMQDDSTSTITGDHDSVRLNVEEKASKWVRLNYRTNGNVAEGYVITNAGPDQTQIEVSGAKSIIDRIGFAYVEMDVAGANTNMSANVEFNLYDKEQNLMDRKGITTNVDLVHMSVEIMAAKEVPIEWSVKGQPAEGFLATGEVESSFETVRLAGNSTALANINKVTIPAEVLDITDVEESVTKTVDLKAYLPDNIKIVDTANNSKLTLNIKVEPVTDRVLEVSNQNITIQGVPKGFECSFEEEYGRFRMEISGLAQVVNPIIYSSVTGKINVEGWMEKNHISELHEGVYEIPVDFDLDKEVTLKEDIKLRVVVEKSEDEE